METASRRGVVVLSAVVVLLLGAVLAWYVTDSLYSSDPTRTEADSQDPLSPPTVQKKNELYHNLQTESATEAQPITTDERERLLQEVQVEQQTHIQSEGTPSEAERQKLLEGLNE